MTDDKFWIAALLTRGRSVTRIVLAKAGRIRSIEFGAHQALTGTLYHLSSVICHSASFGDSRMTRTRSPTRTVPAEDSQTKFIPKLTPPSAFRRYVARVFSGSFPRSNVI